MKEKKIFFAQCIILLVIVGIILAVTIFSEKKEDGSRTSYEKIEELNGKTLAVQTGSVLVDISKEKYPDSELIYYDSSIDPLTSVVQGKVEGTLYYAEDVEVILEEYSGLKCLSEIVAEFPFSFATQKNEYGEALAQEYNEFVNEIKATGEYDKIIEKWQQGDRGNLKLEDYTYTGEKGELVFATVSDWVPNVYVNEYGLVGTFIELLSYFCENRGYLPKFEETNFQSIITGLTTGKYDMTAYGMDYTEERAKNVTFTDPFAIDKAVMMVRDEEKIEEQTGFFKNIEESFKKNFVTDNRWKFLLSGLLVTIGMSLLAMLLGTIVGGVICAMRMSANPFATGFARMYVKFFQGMPIVVLLLILYYVVFSESSFSAFVVCVIGFSIDFSAYVSEIFRTGIETVSIGQRKAAYALGYNKVQTFHKVVFPQMFVQVIPVYCGQLVSMVKMTSIAGYISVQDLTKVSDIIRSRTYEAFFPLVFTAVVYFLIANLLTLALKVLQKRLNPRERRKRR